MKKYMGTSLTYIIFTYLDFVFCQFWKRRAPNNDEDPFNEILKILDMGPISIWKHEMFLGEYVSSKICKLPDINFPNNSFFESLLLNSGGPKTLGMSERFQRETDNTMVEY